MKSENGNKTKRILVICALAILVVLVVAVAVSLLTRSKEETAAEKETMTVADAEDYTGDRTPEPTAVEESPSIAIPGYGTITLKAGQTEQEVSLYNPEENTCYFKMSLILPDGTTIWQGDLLAPGKAFYSITLNQPLSAGEYPDTVLKYDCYSLNDQSQLNGAEIKVNLVVE